MKALSNIDLEIPDSSIFGIIGRSGAGKSTLVRCVNLLERPDSGSVSVSGVELTDLGEGELRQARKKIGMIFQNFNLLSGRTVFGNVAFPLDLAGWRREDIASRVDELLDLVGLADKRERYPSQLSGGQKQRVGIARALANRPDVLLSDEATSALDPLTTRSILSLLRDINTRLGLTIVLITHEMNVIREICTDVAVIDKGRIVERGTVLDIFTDPAGSPPWTCSVTWWEWNCRRLSPGSISLRGSGDGRPCPAASVLRRYRRRSRNLGDDPPLRRGREHPRSQDRPYTERALRHPGDPAFRGRRGQKQRAGLSPGA